MYKSGATVVFGNFAVSLLALARNIIIARLLSVEDFGVASTFALLFALGEAMSDMAVDRLIVQAKDGDERRFQGALHSIQVGRGLISAAALYLLAVPYAYFMGVPDAVWAFQIFAVFPIIRGFAHLDIFRAQRGMRFGPQVAANLGASVISLAAVYPLADEFGDFQVMLWALLIHQMAFLAITHLAAKRAYRLNLDKVVLKRALTFGLPLLGNAVLLFCILNGDRLIVGNQLGMETLGWFAVAATLTLTPSFVLAKSLQSLFLPQLAAVQDAGEQFDRLARATIETGLLIGAALAVGFALLGPVVLILLFGQKYAPALDVLIWFALMHGVRLAKAGPFVVAIAKGETSNPFRANLVRIAFLPVAYVAVQQGAPVVAVVWVAFAGEAASYAASLISLRRRLKLPLAPLAGPFAATAALFLLIAGDAILWPALPAIFSNLHAAQLAIVAGALGLLAAMPALRGFAREQLRARRAPAAAGGSAAGP